MPLASVLCRRRTTMKSLLRVFVAILVTVTVLVIFGVT